MRAVRYERHGMSHEIREPGVMATPDTGPGGPASRIGNRVWLYNRHRNGKASLPEFAIR